MGIPFTVHVTAGFVVPGTVAAKLARWPAVTEAVAGAIATEIGALLTIVTVAEAACEPAVALIVTGFVPGTLAGAVYVAVFAPVLAIVPSVELPPETPLTSHVIAVPAATHSEAEKFCTAPVETFTDGGEIEFALAHEIATLALADFEGSAVLVAVTATLGGDGATAGAVYVAESRPVAAMVPNVGFPPATPLTFQLTAELDAPAPVTVALKFADPAGARLVELGAMLTTMPLWICTLAEPLADGADALVAVIVTVAGEGNDCGAAYSPEKEIAPMTPFPPAMPLTLQFTAIEVAPVTVAVNCCVCPRSTDAVAGATVTLTWGDCELEEADLVRPQPETSATAAPSAAQKNAARNWLWLGWRNRGDGSPAAELFLRLTRRVNCLREKRNMCLRPH